MNLCDPRNTGKQGKALKSFGLKFCAKNPAVIRFVVMRSS